MLKQFNLIQFTFQAFLQSYKHTRDAELTRLLAHRTKGGNGRRMNAHELGERQSNSIPLAIRSQLKLFWKMHTAQIRVGKINVFTINPLL